MFCKQTNIRTHSIFVPYALVSSVLLAIPMSKIISLKHENVWGNSRRDKTVYMCRKAKTTRVENNPVL